MIIETRREDFRNMDLATYYSSSENTETQEAMDEFHRDFMFTFGNCNISELCEMYGISFKTPDDLSVITELSHYSYVAGLLLDENLANRAVLGHYVKDDVHCFPFILDAVLHCERCDMYYPLCVCIYASSTNFGLDEFMIDDSYTLVQDSIRTLDDVYQFMCTHCEIDLVPVFTQ